MCDVDILTLSSLEFNGISDSYSSLKDDIFYQFIILDFKFCQNSSFFN